MTDARTKRRARTTIILFLAILIGPALYAHYLFGQANPQTIKTKNYGELIRPPILLETLSFTTPQAAEILAHRKWSLVLINTSATCDAACEKALYHMRQLHQALHKNQSRLQRAVWLNATVDNQAIQNLITQSYTGMTTFFLNEIGEPLLPADQTACIVLVDPLGNIMMRYPLDADPMKVLKDIKHLHAVSQIG